MTILESIGDYLQTNGVAATGSALTLGTNLFLGIMPETPDACTSVYEFEGIPPMDTMGEGGFRIDTPNIQVLCRAVRDDYPTARDRAQNIRILLSAITEQTISGIHIMRVQSNGSVNPIGTDSNERPLVSVNFRCMVRT
jgi:hypothetical protein